MKRFFAAAVLLAAALGLLSGCEYRGSVGGSLSTPRVTANVTGSPSPIATDAQPGQSGSEGQMGGGSGSGANSGL